MLHTLGCNCCCCCCWASVVVVVEQKTMILAAQNPTGNHPDDGILLCLLVRSVCPSRTLASTLPPQVCTTKIDRAGTSRAVRQQRTDGCLLFFVMRMIVVVCADRSIDRLPQVVWPPVFGWVALVVPYKCGRQREPSDWQNQGAPYKIQILAVRLPDRQAMIRVWLVYDGQTTPHVWFGSGAVSTTING